MCQISTLRGMSERFQKPDLRKFHPQVMKKLEQAEQRPLLCTSCSEELSDEDLNLSPLGGKCNVCRSTH